MRPQEAQMPQSRPKNNTPSLVLTQEENEVVFKMLGRKCQTLNTAVVQIYKTEANAHAHWKKKYTGVVCFVKDSGIRSYFLRAYCLIKNELIWEHELYDAMKITRSRPFLITFEGQDGYVGLNFVSEDECDSFFKIVDHTLETRNRKKSEKKNRPKNAPIAPTSQTTNQTAANATTVQLRNHPKLGSVTLTSAPQQPHKNFLPAGFGLAAPNANRDKKRKVTKADISQPTNFVHISHVGWDADKGFDCTGNENDEYLSKFLTKAGVSETELKDRDTRAFIYDFIQSNNVLASAKLEEGDETPAKVATPVPPPVPSRHQNISNGQTGQRTAPPPPPPARQGPPPVPSIVPVVSRAPAPPSRPSPVIQSVPSPPAASPPPPPPPPPACVPPPPPPPPPMPAEIPSITTTHAPSEPKKVSSTPSAPDGHNALMESIRKGTTLKKVDASSLSTGSGDSRSDLMSEIRNGIELKPAQNRELGSNRNSNDRPGTDALAMALRTALENRGRVIQSSDGESESSGNDDDWDD